MNNLLIITFMVCVTILGVTAMICNRKPQKEVIIEEASKPKKPAKPEPVLKLEPEPEPEPKQKAKPQLVLVSNTKPTHDEIAEQTKTYLAKGGVIHAPQSAREVVVRVLSVATEPMDVSSVRLAVNNLGIELNYNINTKTGRRRFYQAVYNAAEIGFITNVTPHKEGRAKYLITEEGREYIKTRETSDFLGLEGVKRVTETTLHEVYCLHVLSESLGTPLSMRELRKAVVNLDTGNKSPNKNIQVMRGALRNLTAKGYVKIYAVATQRNRRCYEITPKGIDAYTNTTYYKEQNHGA